jgi:hypothetical protein
MITYADQTFVWSRKEDLSAEDNLHTFISVAFGLDDEVKHVFGTYIPFFELLTAGHTLVDASERYNDGKFYVDFVNEGTVVETLEAPELVWALLVSEPVVLELVRDARVQPSYLNNGIAFYVKEGWSYVLIDGTYEFLSPEGWVLPEDASETPEERYAKQAEKIELLKNAYKSIKYLHPDFLKELEDLKLPHEL